MSACLHLIICIGPILTWIWPLIQFAIRRCFHWYLSRAPNYSLVRTRGCITREDRDMSMIWMKCQYPDYRLPLAA